MKKIALLLVCIGLFGVSCANNRIKENEKSEISLQQKNNKPMKTIQLTKAEFLKKVADYESSPKEWKYLGDKPAIIDFYADWCKPCKTIAPILDELAEEYEGQIYIYKVNVDKEQELAGAFGVRSIPTLLFVPMNDKPQMANGAMPKDGFIQAINEVLLKKQ